MDAKRLEDLLSDIWAYVFDVFDREPNLTGEDAGRLATAAEDGARSAALTLTLTLSLSSATVEAAAGR